MTARQEFGLDPGTAARYALMLSAALFVGIWFIATLDPEQVYRRSFRLGDDGVLIVRLVMVFPLAFAGKFLWDLFVSLWLGWRIALSANGIEVNSVGSKEIFEWSNIASVAVQPLKRLRNGDIEVKSLVLATNNGQAHKVNLYAFGLTEGDIEIAFAKYNKSSRSLFK